MPALSPFKSRGSLITRSRGVSVATPDMITGSQEIMELKRHLKNIINQTGPVLKMDSILSLLTLDNLNFSSETIKHIYCFNDSSQRLLVASQNEVVLFDNDKRLILNSEIFNGKILQFQNVYFTTEPGESIESVAVAERILQAAILTTKALYVLNLQFWTLQNLNEFINGN